MNRRNVLGNQMESSKTMWIVLTGILVSALQFGIYYFVSDGWLGLVLVGLCFLLGGVAVHFVTGEIEELFSCFIIATLRVCVLSLCLSTPAGGFSTTSTTWEAHVYCMLWKYF